jgi:hypothetical protein
MPPIVAYPIWIRQSGKWIACYPYIRHGGKWVQPEVWIRHNGKWVRSSTEISF